MTLVHSDTLELNDEISAAISEAIRLYAAKYSAELIAILTEEFDRLVEAVRAQIIKLQQYGTEYGNIQASKQAENFVEKELALLELQKDHSDYLEYMESVGVQRPLNMTDFDRADSNTKRSPREEFKILKRLDIKIGTIITEDNGEIIDGIKSIPFQRYVCGIKPNCHINLKHGGNGKESGYPNNFARHTSAYMMFFDHKTGSIKGSLIFDNPKTSSESS